MVSLSSWVGVKLLQMAIALGISVEVIVFKLRSEQQEAFSHSYLRMVKGFLGTGIRKGREPTSVRKELGMCPGLNECQFGRG